ncbi:MAG: undecaprenyl/decaprenyl-phosphate alpha-N-acetylglucosaminyl 1-phosphate transferase [Eubacterium sp.]|jgi:UDP-GlcNAc:undecaprenyl-phosphate GlcNAc-1-phosphate transferase|nr:undecaprenyl/decaprenyl-phosphate alpha-N-acetylglucosaminyl 1-phosphate transferase [Eubacterium sp.]MCH4047120.1 undecaprenyl/decaprenyl-phosphate alpha-N-acetylglucosaminyl 1-phosphate transferase [Eubacterium sp.]MCH4080217.1 undecaprenyl/decaprenyl-phosphate alpha-N-acetylglucosaminyl 1-phosphate transferase [Eubacterium sp.]MCH4111182.1 undecaprenyl/decaprenyl-phosphate alpha-N-acetylglucosaminyl 1-phosphate transferase [Eubacterium sp.]MCI1306848.1 undecaprenyl/decaprenyl-phosphate al
MQITKFTVFLLFGLSFVISFAATPVARWIAPRIGAMDIPKDSRRMHTRPIPRFGGMAMFLGTIIPILIFLHHHSGMMAAAVGGCMVYALGALDDLKNLSAKLKFTVELLIAALMYAMGLRIKLISNYFGEGNLHFGTAVCFIVTVLWIVGITNTINLVDGLDGLAAGVAMIAALTIAYVAYIHGNTYGMVPVCCAMISLAGSCAGFLPYNFYPASIFMGDSGSLFLGFMIASMSVVGPLKRSTVIAVVIPVIVLGIPIFDTFFAIFRRWVNHRPIMEADKGHLHHHLMASGFGQRRAVLMLYGISGIMGMAAVLVSRELIKDALVLMAIAGVYLYVFLTDPNHKLPHIKAVDTNREEKQQRRMEKWDPKEQQKYGENFPSGTDKNKRDS